MRVALVHDWLTGMRGGERVLEELCALFPDASLFTLFHRKGAVSRRIEAMPIQASLLNGIPGAKRYYRYLLPLFPWAISRFDLRSSELIISVSHVAAKAIRKPPGSLHVCYCLTPMRFVWDMQPDYFEYADRLRIRATGLRTMTNRLRKWDRATAGHVDQFIADSRHVQQRISRYYGREARVVYPPVDTEFFTPSQDGCEPGPYLVVSALVPYKRVDLAVDAFNRLGYPLVIAGAGPDAGRLRRRAASNIQFKGFVTDEELRNLYRQCRAVIVTAREDFGLVSPEAQACGRPVIAFAAGGSLESVVDGETGVLFPRQEVGSLVEAVRRLERISFDRQRLRSNAERFSAENFRRAMYAAIMEEWHSFCSRRSIQSGPRHSPSVAEASRPEGSGGRPQISLAGAAGAAKRCLDIALSLAGLIILGLPVLLAALFIARSTPGPAFFVQPRVGWGRRRFLMFKLRTMFADAEKDGPTWAVRDDPRCTRLGGFLRRYGIDELPQLWNVLKGDMSLVGPRPERPEFQRLLEANLPGFKRRLEVKGGMTGLAQIRGWRGDSSLEERLRCDLEYIEHWSFWRDIGILWQTPRALLSPKSRPRQPISHFLDANASVSLPLPPDSADQ
jgi:lipopolysaccharide/colanic/teichoic acid biosynthesis glycosyltransferase/glycosyltransferase involved in cell wall biosynthesis